MLKLKSKHLLTGNELSPDEMSRLLDLAIRLKAERNDGITRNDLNGKSVILFFEKPSLRTHLSFSVAVQQLGGIATETYSSLRKKEEPEDVARVLSGYAHGIMIRTFDQNLIERFASSSKVPVINGLTDWHHPCQILADLMTLKERFKTLKGLKLAYVGDGNNILHSLLMLAPKLGVDIHYACPKGYEPNGFLLKQAIDQAESLPGSGKIIEFEEPTDAVKNTNAIYTDVWTSMGFESNNPADEIEKEKAFAPYQLNRKLYENAKTDAILMHCMPMVRGKEITSEMADHENSAIWQQSENRLHVQKAILLGLLK